MLSYCQTIVKQLIPVQTKSLLYNSRLDDRKIWQSIKKTKAVPNVLNSFIFKKIEKFEKTLVNDEPKLYTRKKCLISFGVN